MSVIVFALSLMLAIVPVAALPSVGTFAVKEPNPVVETVTLWAVCYMWEGQEMCTLYMPREQADQWLAQWQEWYPEYAELFYLKSTEVEKDNPIITM